MPVVALDVDLLELDVGHHRHLTRAVALAEQASSTPIAASALSAAGFGWAQRIVVGGHRFLPVRNETAAAATIPRAAAPARRYMVGRSAVHTRGSGGRP